MRWLAVFSSITLLVALLLRIQDRSVNALRVTFLDVGQGDSAVVRFPQGTVWLIDAGGGWKQWDRGREIHQELTRWGIRRIDTAWLSHPDMDHGLGFRGLLQSLPISELRYNAVFTPLEQPLLATLVESANQHGTRVIAQHAGFDATVEGVQTRSFASPPSGKTNDSPLLVRLSYAGCRFLFAGDAESKTERRLAKSSWLPVDVLKVNHHGSRTSSSTEFVGAAAAQWALASVGARNHYGHPAPVVARRFSVAGARWLRTDVHGYVEFTVHSSGEIRCQSAAGPCGSSVCQSGSRDLGFTQLQ
jgi:competence protein ComEC